MENDEFYKEFEIGKRYSNSFARTKPSFLEPRTRTAA